MLNFVVWTNHRLSTLNLLTYNDHQFTQSQGTATVEVHLKAHVHEQDSLITELEGLEHGFGNHIARNADLYIYICWEVMTHP